MRRILFNSLVLAAVLAVPASAQQRDVPYWASFRAEEARMRVGPSAEYKIDWVYQRKGLPVKVLRLREGWRLIEDPDGARGWVFHSLLTPDRGALVIGEGLAEMRSEAGGGSVEWRLEPGVVGALGKCDKGWCQLDTGGHKGWVSAERLWGDGDP